MLKLRRHILNNATIWATCLVVAIIVALSLQPHIHIHLDFKETAAIAHTHAVTLDKVHLGNAHDALHDANFGSAAHAEHDTFAVNIAPDAINTLFSLALLFCALIGMVIMLLAPATDVLHVFRHQNHFLQIPRFTTRPPQLRAPPQ